MAVVARQPDGAVAQVLPPSVPYTAVARDEKFWFSIRYFASAQLPNGPLRVTAGN